MFNVLAFQRQYNCREKNSGLADFRWTNHRANLNWVFPTTSGIYIAGSPDQSSVYGRRVDSDGIIQANFSPGVTLIDFSAAGSYAWYANGTQTVTRVDSSFGSAQAHTVSSPVIKRVLALGTTAYCVDYNAPTTGVSLANGSGGFTWRNTYAEVWGNACTDGTNLFLATTASGTPKLRKIDSSGTVLWNISTGLSTSGMSLFCDGNGDVWAYSGTFANLKCFSSASGATLYGNYGSGYPNGSAACADASQLYFAAFDSGGSGLYSISAYTFALSKQWETVQRISSITQIAVDSSYVHIVGALGAY